MTTVRVSCLIPTRNRWSLLQRAVASARAPGVEIVVVDDGSTDETALQGPALEGVRYVRGPGAGVAAARNAGAAVARGEWLAFLDDDDEWLPGKLERQLSWLEGLGAGFGSTGVLEVSEEGALPPRLGPEPGPVPWGRLLQGNFVCTSTVLLRRQVFLEAGGFDPGLRTSEDWDLWLRAALLSPVHHLPEPWTRYRVQGGEKLTADRERLWRDGITVQRRYAARASREWRGPARRTLADACLRVAGAAWRRGAWGQALRDLLAAFRTDPWYALRHLARQALRGR